MTHFPLKHSQHLCYINYGSAQFELLLTLVCCVFKWCPLQKSPQTESCTDSGAENEGSCHSDQMSNDFSTDDCVDEGICLDSTSSSERMLKPKVIILNSY